MNDLEHTDDELLSRLLDGELSLTERSAVLDHVTHCPRCARRQADLVEAAAALRSEPALEWTDEHTAAIVAQLPEPAQRRPRAALGRAAAALAAAVLAATWILSVPVGPILAGAVYGAVSWVPPLGRASAGQALVALVVVALLSPLAVYPLARWR
jgi:anti-sigma factor RsiW